MITYKKGNLLATEDSVIIHGCNARGVMGAGVALQIKLKYPKAFTDYERFCKQRANPLGLVCISTQPDYKVIINAITQSGYSNENTRHVSYDAVDDCMVRIGQYSEPQTRISIPKIGAGLGGGDWKVIEAIINHRLSEFNITVWELP